MMSSGISEYVRKHPNQSPDEQMRGLESLGIECAYQTLYATRSRLGLSVHHGNERTIRERVRDAWKTCGSVESVAEHLGLKTSQVRNAVGYLRYTGQFPKARQRRTPAPRTVIDRTPSGDTVPRRNMAGQHVILPDGSMIRASVKCLGKGEPFKSAVGSVRHDGFWWDARFDGEVWRALQSEPVKKYHM